MTTDKLWEEMTMALPYPVRCLAAALLLLGVPPVLLADPPAKGDLWEVSTRMSMEGMPMEMPAQVHKVCTAKVWTRPPTGENEHQKCKRTDYSATPNKVTWTESCDSPPMTGKGEITRQGSDAYAGTIKYASEQGEMTIKIAGHRIGECDNPS